MQNSLMTYIWSRTARFPEFFYFCGGEDEYPDVMIHLQRVTCVRLTDFKSFSSPFTATATSFITHISLDLKHQHRLIILLRKLQNHARPSLGLNIIIPPSKPLCPAATLQRRFRRSQGLGE
jgi:hypothetical protein